MATDSPVKQAEMAFDAIVDRWLEEVTTPKRTDLPNEVFHYTRAAGLEGILRSHKIFATDYRFLNDKAEILSAEQHVRDVSNEYIDNETVKKVGFLSHINTLVSRPMPWAAYVFSMSERGDDLSQWRGYADDGLGFTIGFDAATISASSGRESYRFQKVAYDWSGQQRLLKLSLTDLIKEMKIWIDRHPDHAPKIGLEAARSFDWLASNHSAFFKHSSFSGEDEWRFVSWIKPSEEELDVRVSGSRLVPFGRLSLGNEPKLPVTSVGVGPGFQSAEVSAAVKILADKCGYKIRVYSAETPYRRT